MHEIHGRRYGLLTVQHLAGHLGLSLHQTYRFVAAPPPGFPPPLPRGKGEKMLYSSVLVDAWLEGADVSGGALPQHAARVWAAPAAAQAKRGPGRPRKQPSTAVGG